MVHILHRVKAMDSQPLESESFRDLLIEMEYQKYALSPHIGKTWFKLTINVVVTFLFWVIFILHYIFGAMFGFI